MLCTLQDDLRKVYEGLMKDVNIRVIELQDHVLSMYDRQISNYTQKEFQRCDAQSEPCQAYKHAESCMLSHRCNALCEPKYDDSRSLDVLQGGHQPGIQLQSRCCG